MGWSIYWQDRSPVHVLWLCGRLRLILNLQDAYIQPIPEVWQAYAQCRHQGVSCLRKSLVSGRHLDRRRKRDAYRWPHSRRQRVGGWNCEYKPNDIPLELSKFLVSSKGRWRGHPHCQWTSTDWINRPIGRQVAYWPVSKWSSCNWHTVVASGPSRWYWTRITRSDMRDGRAGWSREGLPATRLYASPGVSTTMTLVTELTLPSARSTYPLVPFFAFPCLVLPIWPGAVTATYTPNFRLTSWMWCTCRKPLCDWSWVPGPRTRIQKHCGEQSLGRRWSWLHHRVPPMVKFNNDPHQSNGWRPNSLFYRWIWICYAQWCLQVSEVLIQAKT